MMKNNEMMYNITLQSTLLACLELGRVTHSFVYNISSYSKKKKKKKEERKRIMLCKKKTLSRNIARASCISLYHFFF